MQPGGGHARKAMNTWPVHCQNPSGGTLKYDGARPVYVALSLKASLPSSFFLVSSFLLLFRFIARSEKKCFLWYQQWANPYYRYVETNHILRLNWLYILFSLTTKVLYFQFLLGAGPCINIYISSSFQIHRTQLEKGLSCCQQWANPYYRLKPTTYSDFIGCIYLLFSLRTSILYFQSLLGTGPYIYIDKSN